MNPGEFITYQAPCLKCYHSNHFPTTTYNKIRLYFLSWFGLLEDPLIDVTIPIKSVNSLKMTGTTFRDERWLFGECDICNTSDVPKDILVDIILGT